MDKDTCSEETPKHDPWMVLGRFFKTWVGSALYDGGGAEVDLEEPYEAFRAIHAQQTDALGPNIEVTGRRADAAGA